MARFEEFLGEVLERARGRPMPPGRWIPVFVPESEGQQNLFLGTVAYFKSAGYTFLDCSAGTYGKAVASFPLPWPRVSGRPPRLSDFVVARSESSSRLVILGGSDPDPVFWRNLGDEAVLCAGGSFPYSPYVVVPDTATVVALVKADDFIRYRKDYFAEVLYYDSSEIDFPL